MHIKTFHLRRAGTLARAIEDDGSLTIVYGEGGGSTLTMAGSATVACIPIHGSIQVSQNDLTWPVVRREALVTEYGSHVVVVGRARARWIALLAGRQAWALLLPQCTASAGQLLPEPHDADHDMRRLAIAAARAANPASLDAAINALTDKLAMLQEPLREAIARCPGRTWVNRRQVFLRLQRVHNYIGACCDHELDIDELARMANYSPCHFLRTFHVVYQMTPHAYLIDRRLRRAWALLHSSDLAVTEVAVACGFENRSAFSRLFHEHFGTTAQEAKRSYHAARKLPVEHLAA